MSDQAVLARLSAGHMPVHFGGPDCPPRAMRNLLKQRIEAVPASGEIVWATYYFRDEELARAIIGASNRGVKICIHLDGAPRFGRVNKAVIDMLRSHGLNGGLHIHTPPFPAFSKFHPHLHSKIYYFSHPVPTVFVGSFNPSGNDPEEQGIIQEIGDQDRGHNVLVELHEDALVSALKTHIMGLNKPLIRFWPQQNHVVEAKQASVFHYPRLCPSIVDRHIDSIGAEASIHGAISHLKPGMLTDCLIRVSRRGALVRLLVHDTERRVPQKIVNELSGAGIDIIRYAHPDGLPMHAKFLLIGETNRKTSYFGSFNYNRRSRYLNHEILLRSHDAALFHTLAERFSAIENEIKKYSSEINR